jgi:Family of unknown function (DUF5689)
MKNTLIAKFGIALALFACVFFSCVKTEFDEPPITGSPVDIKANITIKELKQLHTTLGGLDKIADEKIIEGVVVMDDRSGNFYKTIVMQDASGGIEVKFNDGYLYNQFPIGRTVYINCKGMLLGDYGGITQLNGGTKEEAGVLSAVGITEAQVRTQVFKGLVSATPPEPRIITLADVTNPDYLSTLVKFENAQFIGADTDKTYADAASKLTLNRTIEDCGGSANIVVRTSGYADFAAEKTPTKSGTITGVLSTYNTTAQLYIRNTADVNFTADRCVIVCGKTGGNVTVDNIDEAFTSVTANQDVTLAGWSNIGSDGCRTWRGKSFSGNVYATVTAFTSQDANNESWLISPAITVSTQKKLSFESSWEYYKHDGLSVWYSTNFDGTNFASATWQPITCTLAQASDKDTNPNFGKWIPSGNINLPVVNNGKIHIGWKYVGSGPGGNTTTWRIDNVKVN